MDVNISFNALETVAAMLESQNLCQVSPMNAHSGTERILHASLSGLTESI